LTRCLGHGIIQLLEANLMVTYRRHKTSVYIGCTVPYLHTTGVSLLATRYGVWVWIRMGRVVVKVLIDWRP